LDSTDTVLLEVSGATRRFAGRPALAGVDLTLGGGELVALLGPNGAGMSSLIGAISGRIALDAGGIRIGGEVAGSRRARQRIGVVPQTVALHPTLGVRENLEILGRLAGVTRDALAGVVIEALGWCGLESRAADPVRTLSGGLQRRLNIAAGTLHRPALLLLDEPTAGLDPAARGQIHAALRGLKAQGMAMLLATHDLHEAQDLADRVAIMVDGMIRAVGAPQALVASAFAGNKELNVLLESDPDGRARTLLGAAGLQPTAIPRLWVGVTDADFQRLAALRAELLAGGVPLLGLRVLEPGLHGVFLRMTGEDLAP
jgi:ABC-2 type transport system ATP-binding protein